MIRRANIYNAVWRSVADELDLVISERRHRLRFSFRTDMKQTTTDALMAVVVSNPRRRSFVRSFKLVQVMSLREQIDQRVLLEADHRLAVKNVCLARRSIVAVLSCIRF